MHYIILFLQILWMIVNFWQTQYFFLLRPVCIIAKINGFFNLLKEAIVEKSQFLPFVVSSKDRWIIMSTTLFDTGLSTFDVNNIQLKLNGLVQQFWSLKFITELVQIFKENQGCEGILNTDLEIILEDL